MTSSSVARQATVLVTGGTGSFGSTMVRRLLDSDVREVRVFSRDELKQDDMRRALATAACASISATSATTTASTGPPGASTSSFTRRRLKQVPSCEFFPQEAVRTNVLGSHNVIEASNANGVAKVVCLGTDKAVYPVNAMGMSKAMMEKTAQAFARNNPTATTVVSTVRYGNVMCSRGSVIPLFVEQLRKASRSR